MHPDFSAAKLEKKSVQIKWVNTASETIHPTTLLHTSQGLNLQPCHCQTVQALVLSHQLVTINILDQSLVRLYGIYGVQ
jgi:hypothetical protein